MISENLQEGYAFSIPPLIGVNTRRPMPLMVFWSNYNVIFTLPTSSLLLQTQELCNTFPYSNHLESHLLSQPNISNAPKFNPFILSLAGQRQTIDFKLAMIAHLQQFNHSHYHPMVHLLLPNSCQQGIPIVNWPVPSVHLQAWPKIKDMTPNNLQHTSYGSLSPLRHPNNQYVHRVASSNTTSQLAMRPFIPPTCILEASHAFK